ncbi:MAG: radical SAM protein [Candidatus Omnitrophota bacterium]|nr:radical SAM protein [Candidatus Omnitrophota bacterium]
MEVRTIRIGITNFCNLRCPYCFFYESLTTDSNNQKKMSVQEMEEVLRYCRKDNVRVILLHGGEPMMHSEIESIIKLIRKNKIGLVLFTNGIFDQSLLKIFSKKDIPNCLVNYNHPAYFLKTGDWELVNRNIKKMCELGYGLALGYNLFEKKPDYKFFIDAIKRFRIKKIRFDLAKPSLCSENKYVSLKDFFNSAGIVAKFLKDCLNAGAWPQLDCAWPICFTSRKEFDFMRKFIFNPRAVCSTLLDILPGLTISTCPCSVTKQDIKLSEFESLSQAKAFFVEMEDSFRWRYYATEMCKGCIFWVHRVCEGGCQGYKRIFHRDMVTRQDLKLFLLNKSNSIYTNSKTIKVTSKMRNNYMSFRLGSALLQQDRIKDAFIVFLAVKKTGLKNSEQKYVESFLKRCLNK